jgi:arginase
MPRSPRGFEPGVALLPRSSKPGLPHLIGLPYDASSSFLPGPAEAPPLIRAALRSPHWNSRSESGTDVSVGASLQDVGDLHLPAAGWSRDRIESGIADLLARGARPLALGGDHSVTYPILRAMARRHHRLTILHIDAHSDLYEEFEGDRFSHACPFARIMEERLATRLVQVGIRTMNPHQQGQAERFGVDVIDMRRWEAGDRPAIDGEVYLSVDLDALDPAFAPGVSHHEPGGLSVRELLSLVQNTGGTLSGADVVEYNPRRDIGGVTATVAAKIVKEIAGRMLLPIVVGLLGLLVSSMSAPLAAQAHPRMWLGLGPLGSAARGDGAEGMAVMAEIVYQTGPHYFALRAAGAADPLGEGADEFGDFGLLYGRAALRPWGHASVAAGLAITGVSSCHDALSGGTCTTLGIPLTAEAALRMGSFLGVGVQGFANLNSKSVYGGVVVFLQVGSLRR